MNDLFRFLMLRPPETAKPEDTKPLAATYVAPRASRDAARKAAKSYVDGKAHATSGDGMKYAKAAFAVVAGLAGGRKPAADISALVSTHAGVTAAQAVADPKFGAEESRIADTLVAMKLLSDSFGGDAPGLARLAQGYDAIRLAATGRDPIALRVLAVIDVPAVVQPGAPPEKDAASPPAKTPADRYEGKALEKAMTALEALPAAAFRAYERKSAKRTVATPKKGETLHALAEPASTGRPWMLAPQAIKSLPADVRATLAKARVDPATQSLPAMLNALHATRIEAAQSKQGATLVPGTLVYPVGNHAASIDDSDYVGAPRAQMPTRPGDMRHSIGIGDLLLVKDHVLRYEGGDLAHVENVLKSEHQSRETRRLERVEASIVQETESTQEETRDTQSTERFSLKRETSDTIKSDVSLKAGLSIAAKYGPFVEAKASTDVATSVTIESSAKQAAEFSKDVVSRSTSKLVERVMERRSVTTISEFEEKFSHGFDNTAPNANHISGYYQWIDKVMHAQVYNYGKRLMFDVTLPEPGTNYILAQTLANDPAQALAKPDPFVLTALEITEENYRAQAHLYDAVGLEPPPPVYKTIAKTYDADLPDDPHGFTKSETITLEDGYFAKKGSCRHMSMFAAADPILQVVLGAHRVNLYDDPDHHVDLDDEEGSIGVAVLAHRVRSFVVTVEVHCKRSPRALEVWQLKTHAAISQAYQVKLQAYEQSLERARAEAGAVIAGRNPAFNTRVVTGELRKQCITLVTGQHFEAFGALSLSSQGYAQPNLSRTAAQMPYVRFFEQAFEWEHIAYFFYPYFWGWKDGWKNRMLIDDVDAPFGDFLRAGAARVVFPVRPGFEAAVLHYLETGEIWNGGEPPEIADGSLFVPIFREIMAATGAPGSEVPVESPWEVRLPTTLVRIRPNNDLPTWQQVGGAWQATN